MPAEPVSEAPVGFWTDLASQVRKELRPPLSGFFMPSPTAPVQGILQGNELKLVCANSFTVELINKPEVLTIVSRKASAMLGRQVRTVAVDKTAARATGSQMNKLLDFGRAHPNIVKIKE